MHDLIAFLRARLDEQERKAREAAQRAERWPVNGTWHLEGVEHDVVGDEEAYCAPHNVEHIAANDPAYVLADVDAKRRIIGQMADEAAEGEYWLEYWREGSRPGNNVEVAIWALLTLALPYADHPDYREEWRP